ncbi:uncharacterized protein TNCV_3516401 [Trichonephila clavipes]|nr:uncharacterized protein TNCV_3516401 [Trichonephila clavipes]
MNELQRNEKTEYRSNGIDLFSYLMRNEKTVSHPPTGFNTFLQGILDANIPLGWIVAPSDSSKPKTLTTAERLRKLSMVRTCWKRLKLVLRNGQVGKICENSQIKTVHQNHKNSASKLDDMERLKKLYYDPKEPGSFEVSKD